VALVAAFSTSMLVAPARADVVLPPDAGAALATYSYGPGPTYETDLYADVTWQGAWRIGGTSWVGTLHGSNGYFESGTGYAHIDLSGYSGEHVHLYGSCETPYYFWTDLAVESYRTKDQFRCSLTLGLPVPKQAVLIVRRGESETLSTEAEGWARYRETLTALSPLG